MEDNNKLFVFEKKEVVLIFIFIILIAVISFTLGVRTGKQISLKNDDFTQEDIQNINLKSVVEEEVEDVVEDTTGSDFEKSMEDEAIDSSTSKSEPGSMEERLKEEMAKLANEKIKVDPVSDDNDSSAPPRVNEVAPTQKVVVSDPNQLEGKYTIQIYSHPNREIAQEFADGFIVKGYDIVINEAVIPEKGKWFRVGVGIFDTVSEAEAYLQKEKDLFQDNNYLIQKL